MTERIRFGTDGWRAVIAREFTEKNIQRLTWAVGEWLRNSGLPLRVVIGYDCRFGGSRFAHVAAQVFLGQGVEVLMTDRIVTTPMLSMATRDRECGAGVMFTASHNAPDYQGFKLKSHLGGPMGGAALSAIEQLIPDSMDSDFKEDGAPFTIVDLETPYVHAIETRFDMDALRAMSDTWSYDAMYGAGQFVMERLFPEADLFRCEHNPHFYGLSPEPIERNLGAFSEHLKSDERLSVGLVNDGDADRIGMMDGDGRVIDSHHIIALLVHYLHHYQGRSGKVVTAFSTVDAVSRLCEGYGLPLHLVKIGFKYASEVMVDEPVMLAGEESGGIADPEHIPERDGIWIGLTILEFLAKSQKDLHTLIEEIYEMTGRFHYLRNDLKISLEKKEEVISKCLGRAYTSFGSYEVERVEDMDGWKFRIPDSRWIMIRPSGTEPVLRVYIQGRDEEEAKDLMMSALETLGVQEG